MPTERPFTYALQPPAPGIGSQRSEYDRVFDVAPLELLVPLFALVMALGMFLTALVPSAYLLKAVSAWGRDDEWLTVIWSVALSALSFFVLLRWCVIQTMAFIAHCRQDRTHTTPAKWPFVSILVPAYQESETIVSALQSLVELDYPLYEIIVVDDGSKDDTFAKASRFAGDHDRCAVRLFRKPNGGKWSALNLAFAHSSGEFVLCIDADSRLGRDALKRLASRMESPGVAGVSGQITVRNRKNIITRLQAYEYVVANGGLRMAQSLLGLVLVVPGPIGLYRRTILQAVFEQDGQTGRSLQAGEVPGPYSHETFAEDFQLSLTILAMGGRIVYEPRALSFTKSPELTQSLLNQRYRWFRGNMQVLRIYLRRLRHIAHPKPRRLDAAIAAIYPLDLYILPAVNFVVFSGLLLTAADNESLWDLLLWVSAIWLLNLLAATYHILVQGDDLSLLCLAPLYDLYHGLLLASSWAIASFDELRQSKMHW